MSDDRRDDGAPRWSNPNAPAPQGPETPPAAASAASPPPPAGAAPGAVRLEELLGAKAPPIAAEPPAAPEPPPPVETTPAAPPGGASPSERVIEVGPVGRGPVRLGWEEAQASPPPETAAREAIAEPPPPPAAPPPAPRKVSSAAIPPRPADTAAPVAEPPRRPVLIDDYESEPPPPRRPATPLPDPRTPPQSGVGRTLLIGFAALAVLGVLALLLLWATVGRDGDGSADDRAVASGSEGATRTAPAPAALQAPDREAVRAAYAEVARIYQGERVSGLTQAGQRCFAGLGQASAYRDLDYCLAFDAFGAAFAHREAGAPAPAESYFGQTEPRALRAGEVVMRGAGDPSVRLVQIRQLALEVAREGAPAYAQAAPPPAPGAAEPPSEPPTVNDARPTSPAPAQRAELPNEPARPAPARPAPAQPPVRRAEAPAPARPAPAREVDREAYAAARDSGPTAAEVAAARPRAGRGPSFNCRYARSTSERMVCDNPRLAALDRRLNAAYEDAIAAGVPRRRLRAEQDSWLLTREHAAPDPDAVADAYRRRIEELRAAGP